MGRLLPLGFAALLLCGCSSRPKLAGSSWDTDLMGAKSTFTFENNGAVKMTARLPIGSFPASGTYSETDKSLGITLQNIDIPRSPIGDGAKKLLNAVIGRAVNFDLAWKSPDEVELTPQIQAGPFGQVMILKRTSPQ